MRRLVFMVPGLVACAGGHVPVTNGDVARTDVASLALTPAEASDTAEARTTARLAPPFHAGAASVRQVDSN